MNQETSNCLQSASIIDHKSAVSSMLLPLAENLLKGFLTYPFFEETFKKVYKGPFLKTFEKSTKITLFRRNIRKRY